MAGKNAVLQWEIYTGRIHQIDDRNAIAHRDFLRAQNLGDGLRPPGTRFDGGIVSDNNRRPSFDLAEPCDNSCGRGLSIVSIVRDQQSNFKEHRAGIQQLRDSLARGELAIAMLLLDFLWPPTQAKPVLQLVKALDKLTHGARGGGRHVYRIQEAGGRWTVDAEPRP